MKSNAMLFICRLLIATMTFLAVQSAHAGMIGTSQAISASSGQVDRDALLRAMGRSEVSSQLQTMGIDPQTAQDRVAAMTDEEVHSLAGKLNTLPAGANGEDWGWALAAVIVIAVLIYYNYGWKK
ncbi:MAG: hypothetical protein H6R10_1972 [Rhodocyclaceae bacterium]|nr:hypothetical protein [Rhodocyclaceae bacterium]